MSENIEIVNMLFENFDIIADAPGGIKKIREMILQLAVQGKLTEQDPSDEPAEILLEKIKKEKEKLIKEGKIKRTKKIAKITDDGKKYQIPKGWLIERFGELIYLRDGDRIPLSRDVRITRQGEYDYYGASGVIDKIDGYIFDKTLLLIGEDGANLINRSTPIAFMAYGKYWVNNHAHVIDSISEPFLNYLCLYINSIDLKPYVTGTAQPKMNQVKMNSIPVLVPPISEQKRIVAKVDSLMALCDKMEKEKAEKDAKRLSLGKSSLNQLLTSENSDNFSSNWQNIVENFNLLFSTPENVKELKKAILQLAVQGKLVKQDPNDEPASVLLEKIKNEKAKLIKEGKIKKQKPLPEIKEDEIPFELPEGWCLCKIGDLIELVSGQHLKPNEYNTINKGFSYYTGPADFGNQSPTPSRWTEVDRALAIKGDILLTVKGSGVGKTNLLFEEKAAISRQLMALRPINANRSYVLLFMKTSFDYLKNLSVGIAIPGISRDDVLNRVFPLPPNVEQKRIVTKVDALMELCDKLEKNFFFLLV